MSEVCPICYENIAEYITDCNHVYCINCLCRIKKCAICRRVLKQSIMCVEITQQINLIHSNLNSIIFNNNQNFDTISSATGFQGNNELTGNQELTNRLFLPFSLQRSFNRGIPSARTRQYL